MSLINISIFECRKPTIMRSPFPWLHSMLYMYTAVCVQQSSTKRNFCSRFVRIPGLKNDDKNVTHALWFYPATSRFSCSLNVWTTENITNYSQSRLIVIAKVIVCILV